MTNIQDRCASCNRPTTNLEIWTITSPGDEVTHLCTDCVPGIRIHSAPPVEPFPDFEGGYRPRMPAMLDIIEDNEGDPQ